jgi:hypothetical protein
MAQKSGFSARLVDKAKDKSLINDGLDVALAEDGDSRKKVPWSISMTFSACLHDFAVWKSRHCRCTPFTVLHIS